jgi:hypothetical protein
VYGYTYVVVKFQEAYICTVVLSLGCNRNTEMHKPSTIILQCCSFDLSTLTAKL